MPLSCHPSSSPDLPVLLISIYNFCFLTFYIIQYSLLLNGSVLSACCCQSLVPSRRPNRTLLFCLRQCVGVGPLKSRLLLMLPVHSPIHRALYRSRGAFACSGVLLPSLPKPPVLAACLCSCESSGFLGFIHFYLVHPELSHN